MQELASPISVGLVPGAQVTREDAPGGAIYIVTFPNGWGASVAKHRESYGVELAVVNPTGDLDFSTPITKGVLPWLTPAELVDALHAVAAL
jgi:hypothetical protein